MGFRKWAGVEFGNGWFVDGGEEWLLMKRVVLEGVFERVGSCEGVDRMISKEFVVDDLCRRQ